MDSFNCMRAEIVVALLGLATYHGSQALAGQVECDWSLTPQFDSVTPAGLNPNVKGVNVKETVPGGTVVFLTLTGKRKGDLNDPSVPSTTIMNSDGETPTYRCNNIAGGDGTKRLKTGRFLFNGLVVTDVEQRTEFGSEGLVVTSATLHAGAFKPQGSLEALGKWLSDNGFSDEIPLTVPDFLSLSEPDLFFGVRLEQWSLEGVTVNGSSVGSQYGVLNGVITNKISGDGPEASQLTSFIVATASLEEDLAGGWSVSSPSDLYTGTAELFGWHEFSVPGPGVLPLLALATVASVAGRRRQIPLRATEPLPVHTPSMIQGRPICHGKPRIER